MTAELLARSDLVLLISCFGDDDTGGGLFAFDGQDVTCIDRVSSTGLCLAGDRLIRLLRSAEGVGCGGEMVEYDQRGITRYLRISANTPVPAIWGMTH